MKTFMLVTLVLLSQFSAANDLGIITSKGSVSLFGTQEDPIPGIDATVMTIIVGDAAKDLYNFLSGEPRQSTGEGGTISMKSGTDIGCHYIQAKGSDVKSYECFMILNKKGEVVMESSVTN